MIKYFVKLQKYDFFEAVDFSLCWNLWLESYVDLLVDLPIVPEHLLSMCCDLVELVNYELC